MAFQTVDVDLSIPGAPPLRTSAAEPTAADADAARNFDANRQALLSTQPQLACTLVDLQPDATWIFGRDGALTALDARGQWWSGCSLPHRAACAMLAKLELHGATGCFLAPDHAAQIDAALAKIDPKQAIIAIVPNLTDLAVALRCCDFSIAIRAHRLWLAAGPRWEEELRTLLAQQIGLSEPQQFIRVPTLAEDAAATLVASAQRVLADEAQRRRARLAELRSNRPTDTRGICVVAPSRFRLWNDAGNTLAEAMTPEARPCTRLDPDDPAGSSSLALAEAAARSRAVLAANVTRADWPDVIHPSTPVITWLTVRRIVPFARVSPSDAMIVADERWLKLATDAGWPRQRLSVLDWPVCETQNAAPANAPLALIADTTETSSDGRTFDLSSHRLLWDAIAQELLADPFALGTDIGVYLSGRMRRLGIGPEGFEQNRFVEDLILPAYQQGLARRALKAGLPLRLYGRGWGTIPDFASHAAGPIDSHRDLLNAARQSAALLHVWPVAGFHPIQTLGRPVVRSHARSSSAWIDDCRKALKLGPPAPGTSHAVLSAPDLLRFIQSL